MVQPPPFDSVLAAAARLQQLVPDAVLVGGTAAALRAGHRVSLDDDHVVTDLAARFDAVLAALEDSRGWVTARVKRPVLILGRLDGVETGIRNLIRRRALVFEEVDVAGYRLRVPTLAETARIKAWLCLVRNATRDYLDFVALAEKLGEAGAARLILGMDEYYADQIGEGGRRIATQLAKQLAEPRPGDRSAVDLERYRELDLRWHDWGAVIGVCQRVAAMVLEQLDDPHREEVP